MFLPVCQEDNAKLSIKFVVALWRGGMCVKQQVCIQLGDDLVMMWKPELLYRVLTTEVYPFSALTLLVGRQEEHLACKK